MEHTHPVCTRHAYPSLPIVVYPELDAKEQLRQQDSSKVWIVEQGTIRIGFLFVSKTMKVVTRLDSYKGIM